MFLCLSNVLVICIFSFLLLISILYRASFIVSLYVCTIVTDRTVLKLIFAKLTAEVCVPCQSNCTKYTSLIRQTCKKAIGLIRRLYLRKPNRRWPLL